MFNSVIKTHKESHVPIALLWAFLGYTYYGTQPLGDFRVGKRLT